MIFDMLAYLTTAKVKVQIEWKNQLITYDATRMYGINSQP